MAQSASFWKVDEDRGDRRDKDRDRKKSRRSRSRSRDRDGKHRSSHRSRSRSGSPPARRRRERKSGFDVAPAGGVVPGMLPGALPAGVPGSAVVSGFSAPLMGAPTLGMGVLPGGIQPPSQQATRHARRVYVGGLPPTGNEQNIATFFSNALAAVGGTTAGPGPCVVNVYINYEKKFAFVEFRTVEETSNAMALDGIMFEGVSVRVRRPNDYNPAMASALGPSVPNPALNLAAIGLTPGGGGGGLGGVQMLDAAERVFVGGLPYYLSEEQCRELLGSFGAIKSFDLVKDRETGNSKGYGFVVYGDPNVTDIACAGLNGMRMGERTLTVRRATESKPPDGAGTTAASGMMYGGAAAAPPANASRIVKLEEAVTPDELANDEEYQEIMEDMRDECSKYGQVNRIVIPRPAPPGQPPPLGVGKVIIEFQEPGPAMQARNAMHGRKFGGRTVIATFLTEEQYAGGQFE
ncbi:hypothetical protein WJX72_009674 [[Myrmecia] bisecta]|uniref:Splicing factor U2af large subunit n=1 Tax=[Myrmecia] bisecta TaxID=41462 RepID=A0AAW1QTC9_9CHLO